MEKTILGLDLSLTATGYCFLYKDNVLESGTIKNKLKGYERLQRIVQRVCHRTEHFLTPDGLLCPEISVVCVEGYSFTNNTNCLTQLAELAGIVKYLWRQDGVSIVIVQPTEWKKALFGYGGSFIQKGKVVSKKGEKEGNINKGFAKNIYMQLVKEKYDRIFQDDNEADAFCIAKYLQEKEQ